MSLQAYAQNMHIPFIETSAKTGSKVTEAFEALVCEMQCSSDPEQRTVVVDLPSSSQREKKPCYC